MPIFGTSTASGRSRVRVEAARGYSDHDLGRILSECAVNDMRVFNAGISRDFQEATALREGTMVKSELQSFQEFSVKDAWAKIKEKLKKLWVKIKGVFRQVYAKLSLWINRNTKAYIAQNKAALKKKKNLDKAKCPKFRTYKNGKSVESAASDYHTVLQDVVKDIKEIKSNNSSGYDTTIAFKDAIDSFSSNTGRNVNAGGEKSEIPSAEEMYQALEEEIFNDADSDQTWSSVKGSIGGNVEGLCNNLSASSKHLKSLKKMNKSADQAMSSLISWCDKKGNEDTKNEIANSAYSAVSKQVSYFQTFVSNCTKAHIRLVKKAISNERGLIAALVAFNPDDKDALNDSAMMEFAFQAGAAAYFHEADDMSEDEVEAAAEEEGITITIEIENDSDADVDVDDSGADGDDGE